MSFGNPPRITESFKRFVTSLPALFTPWPFFKFDSPFVAFPFHRHATRNILQVLSRVSFLFFSFFSLSSFVSKAINPFGLLPRSSPLFLSLQESAVQIIALAVNCVAILKNHRFSAQKRFSLFSRYFGSSSIRTNRSIPFQVTSFESHCFSILVIFN